MDPNDIRDEPFECVEPELGARLPLLDDEDADPALRARLRDHLVICAACGLEREIAARVGAGLRAGTLTLDPEAAGRKGGRRPRTGLVWGGAGALAASLLLALLLPPVPAGDGPLRRSGGEEPRFLRPVEGEVVLNATPHLQWSPVAGATAYEVEVAEIGGPYAWSGRSAGPEISLPAAGELPGRGRFRALVRPVPADLAGTAGLSTAFVRGGLREFLGYRVQASAPAARMLAGAGLVLILLGWRGAPRRRVSS